MGIVTVTKKTDTPTVSIAREGYSFKCSWTVKTDHNDGQEFQARMLRIYSDGSTAWIDWFGVDTSTNTYETNTDSKHVKISKSIRKRTIYFNPAANYAAFACRVRGNADNKFTKISKPSGNPHDQHYYIKKEDGSYAITSDTKVKSGKTYYKCTKYTMSDWGVASLYFWRPALNPITSTPNYQSTVTQFSWDLYHDGNDANRVFTYWQYQSALIPNSTGAPWHIDYPIVTGGVGAEQGSASFDDHSYISGSNYSITRWIRVRPIGPVNIFGDNSVWVESYHTYAVPEKATVTNASYIENSKAHVEYRTNSTFQHPVDKSIIQYKIDTPTSTITETSTSYKMDLYCPSGEEGWQDFTTLTSPIPVNIQVGNNLTDKAVYVRIKNVHDDDSNYTISNPVLVSRSAGSLAKPVIKNVVPITSKIFEVTIERNTQLEHAFTAIWYRTSKYQANPTIVGIIRHDNATQSIQIRVDYDIGDSPDFGAQTIAGSYSPKSPKENEPTYYTVNSVYGYDTMKSTINWDGGEVPVPPVINAIPLDHSTIQVSWISPWKDANFAELSWSTDPDSWQSTNEPSVYMVKNSYASSWNISGLNIDSWYIRVRMVRKSGESETYSTYSDVFGPIQLASAPVTPTLIVSPQVVPIDGVVNCAWVFVSDDSATQASGTIYEAYTPISNPSGNPKEQRYYEYDSENDSYMLTEDPSVIIGKNYFNEYGKPLYVATTASSISLKIDKDKFGWNTGEKHYICVGVRSTYGVSSSVSPGVPIRIADPIEEVIVTSSLIEETKITDYIYPEVEEPSGNPHENEYYEYDSTEVEYFLSEDISVDPGKTYYLMEAIYSTNLTLTTLPLSVSATGAGAGGKTTYYIERAIDFTPYTPNESDKDGFAGETIAIAESAGEVTVLIDRDSLIGELNDGAVYKLYAVVTDIYGQTAKSDDILFIVDWTHKASRPEANIVVDTENLITRITPYCTANSILEGDLCDIYRLSVEKPELIIKDGVFGEEYVDPYPTLGRFGGHRIVYKTFNGDIITETRSYAINDYTAIDDDDIQDLFAIVIDFDGKQLRLPYNVTISNSWTKSFAETKYLGGGVVGDWNPSTSKQVSLNTVIPVEVEPEKMEILNRLSTYAGICHVRTPDGASFSANVDVKDDREERKVNQVSKVSLSITKIESERFDGMTYEEWLLMKKVRDDEYE